MIRMIPFIYNSEIAYEVEFGNLYARFYYDKEVLLDENGYDAVIGTPYLEADLLELQFKQIGDTMWIVHQDYAPRKLTRTTAYTFSLDVIVFENGPFRVRNDILEDDDVTMTSDVYSVGGTGTLTASAETFVAGHDGALFSLTYPKDSNVSEGSVAEALGTPDVCPAIDVKGTVTFVTHGTWSATIVVYRNENGTGWDVYRTYTGKDDRNIQYTWTETEDNVQYKAVVTAFTSGTVNAEIAVNNHLQIGVVRIDSITSPTVAAITVMTKLPTTNGLVATYRWAEGAWSDYRGYPVSLTFFEGRCVYVGGNTIWASKSGDFERFEEGVLDADSFWDTIPTTNEIRWVESTDSVLIGTSGDEWIVTRNKIGTPMTPSNYIIEPLTAVGSARIQPVKINNAILFVDFVGRKIRELSTGSTDRYVTPDMTILSEHITSSGILGMSLQRNPEIILWCWLTDGTLLSMTYEREQDVVAWSKHPTDGQVLSVSVIPGVDEDEVWISVEREVVGVDTVLIEVFVPRVFDTISDCHFVDSGVFYDGTAATVITGLDHLAGETVHILADGVVVDPQVVSAAGTITLAVAASKVHAGLPYTPKLEPMRPDVATRGGTTHSSLVKVPEMGISFLNTMNATYGVSDSKQFDINWTDARWQNNTEITGLFTGDVVVAVDGGFTLDNNLIISNHDPLPMTVRALIPKLEKTGR